MSSNLLNILLDKDADEADRDDAATWLRDCVDDLTLKVLHKIASDITENCFIRNKVGNVLGDIITKRNNFNNDKKYLNGLTEESLEEALDYIRSVHPEWLDNY